MFFQNLKSNSYFDVVFNISSQKYENYDNYNRENTKQITQPENQLWQPEKKNSKIQNLKKNCNIRNAHYHVKVDSYFYHRSDFFYWSRMNDNKSKIPQRYEYQAFHTNNKIYSTAPHPNILPLPPIYWYKNVQPLKCISLNGKIHKIFDNTFLHKDLLFLAN